MKKMEGDRCLVVRWLLVVVGLCVVDGARSVDGGGVKASRLAVSISDSTVVLCALSEANQTLSVGEPPTPADLKLPQQVRCARHCTSQAPNCHSFNYCSDNVSCQFYHYPPTICEPAPSCQYYQVSLFQILSTEDFRYFNIDLSRQPYSGGWLCTRLCLSVCNHVFS